MESIATEAVMFPREPNGSEASEPFRTQSPSIDPNSLGQEFFKMMTTRTLFAMIASAAVATALPSTGAFAQATSTPAATPATKPAKDKHADKAHDAKHQDEKKSDEIASVGKKAPDFSLFDTEGKEHKLSSLAGKIVVIEWFNPECPYVVKQHAKTTTVKDMVDKYAGKDVVFFAINSNATGEQGSGKDRNAKAAKDWAIKYPVLLDETGATGKAYGAKNTPAMYVVNKDGILAYSGAIDDDKSAETAGKTNYVTKAVDELLAGKKVTTSETRPYGCGVKYKH